MMAAFRLAFYLKRPVSELNMTWREFCHWTAYLDLEPPDRSANQRTATILAQITNMSGKSLPKGKSVSPDDFMGAANKSAAQTADEQKAFLKSLRGKKNGS